MGSLKKVTAGLQKAEDGMMVLLFAIMIIAAFAQVVNRNIIKYPISWLEELARYSMIYLTMFATEAGLRDGTQISVEAVVDKLPGMARRVVKMIARVVLTAFAIIVFGYSIPVIQNQISSGQITPGLRIPMVFPYFALSLGFGLIAITQTCLLGTELFGKKQPPQGEVDV